VALYNQNRYKEARPLLQKACDGGEMDGCFKLGHIYNSVEGVPRDFALGCSLWRKACDGGLGAGCFNFRTAGCSTLSAASAEPTVHDEVEKIRSGTYAPMPPAQRSSVSGAASGGTTMTVLNSTAYQLSVFYDGPVSTKLTLAPGASQTIDLAPGAFHVAGRVSAADVLPFYGEETYIGSASYSETFYIR
jgi:TPR repeat protein